MRSLLIRSWLMKRIEQKSLGFNVMMKQKCIHLYGCSYTCMYIHYLFVWLLIFTMRISLLWALLTAERYFHLTQDSLPCSKRTPLYGTCLLLVLPRSYYQVSLVQLLILLHQVYSLEISCEILATLDRFVFSNISLKLVVVSRGSIYHL